MSTMPCVRARPIIDSARAGSTMPGNSVTMSMRIGRLIAWSELQQALRRPDHHSASRQVDLPHDLGHGRNQPLATAVADDPPILRGPLLDPGHATDITPIVRQHPAALELPRIESSGW